jgi:hypothetical protein
MFRPLILCNYRATLFENRENRDEVQVSRVTIDVKYTTGTNSALVQQVDHQAQSLSASQQLVLVMS